MRASANMFAPGSAFIGKSRSVAMGSMRATSALASVSVDLLRV